MAPPLHGTSATEGSRTSRPPSPTSLPAAPPSPPSCCFCRSLRCRSLRCRSFPFWLPGRLLRTACGLRGRQRGLRCILQRQHGQRFLTVGCWGGCPPHAMCSPRRCAAVTLPDDPTPGSPECAAPASPSALAHLVVTDTQTLPAQRSTHAMSALHVHPASLPYHYTPAFLLLMRSWFHSPCKTRWSSPGDSSAFDASTFPPSTAWEVACSKGLEERS
jgi:hypothetical protein